jgi:HlyD family secretion protein
MAKKKKKTGLIITLSIVGLAVIALVVFSIKKKDKDIVEVTTTKVERKTIIQIVSAIGKISPETEVKVSSEASGELIVLNAKEGDKVTVNQLLARIKPDIIESQLEQTRASVDASSNDIEFSKASLDLAKAEFDRTTKLFTKQFISKQEFEAAKTKFEQAKSTIKSSQARHNQTVASLKQIQSSANRTSIYSPINGIVTLLNVKKGEKVLGTQQFQGTELLRVSDLSIMNAMVDVDENDIIKVKLGDTARIEVDALNGQRFTGVVIEIGNAAIASATSVQDQVTNFKVKLRVLNPSEKFRPGMSCSVDIETDVHKNVLSVPLMAVTVRTDETKLQETDKKEESDEDDGKEVKVKKTKPKALVFKKAGSVAKIQYVETGISDNGFIEIKSGLNEGEVIISGNFNAVSKTLKNDSKIKLESTEAKDKPKK